MLLEHHRERAVAQRPVKLVALEALLDQARALEQLLELGAIEILKLQKMANTAGHASSGRLRGRVDWPQAATAEKP